MKVQKIIRYRISISRFFPATHPRKGQETHFIEQIESGEKIHTIRANFALWCKRMKKVREGKAVIELYYWSGKPYHSKAVTFKVIDITSGCGIQHLNLNRAFETNSAIVSPASITWMHMLICTTSLSKHDGLALNDFTELFKYYDLSKPMAIIQFTRFRYSMLS